jgi:hypothetical protein
MEPVAQMREVVTLLGSTGAAVASPGFGAPALVVVLLWVAVAWLVVLAIAHGTLGLLDHAIITFEWKPRWPRRTGRGGG